MTIGYNIIDNMNNNNDGTDNKSIKALHTFFMVIVTMFYYYFRY